MKGRCPICGKTYEIDKIHDLPSFPFCSPRCRLIDQARWADGAYVIPGPQAPPTPNPAAPEPDEDE